MARVTKINVGGTNYDIAHEGELKNSGFEVVTSLPITNLFEGRQVTYNGRNYVYNGRTWIDLYNPAPTFEEPYPYTMTTQELTHRATAISDTVSIQLLNSIGSSLLSIIDDVSGDNYLIETNDGSGWSVANGSITSYRRIPVGSSIRYTAFKDMNQSPEGLGFFFAVYKDGNYRLKTTSRYDIEFYIPNDNGVAHWRTVYSQQFDKDEGCYWFFPAQKYWRMGTNHNQEITNARITITTISSTSASFPETVVSNIKFLTRQQLTSKTTPVYINYDAVINPTQSTKTYKTIEWVLQYLVQGVNWVKANNVRLSAYNTKVAALEQADSDNNASIQSVNTDLTELSNNLATVATSGSYNDLTNTPNLATVATSGSYNDLTDNPTQLPNPNPIIIKTAADGVSVRYDGSTSGGVILEAGDNAVVTATQDSDDMMTVKFGAVVPQTLPNPNALNITVLDSVGALLGPSMVYDGVDAKYLKLIEGYGITLSNTNLNNSHEVTINLKQIAGTTLLGNANGTTNIPQAVTMEQLRTMLGSLTLNGISVTLGGNSSYTLPCFISYSGTLFQARIENNWLQIYRNGVWANLYYLLSSLPTECRYITDLSDPSWFDESVSEYELDNSATTQLLSANSSVNLANWIKDINANQITFNSSVIASKDKGALDNIISNLKGEGYSVFVENDIDTILSSGNDWVISIKIKRFNDTYKAIIECYVAR